MGCADPCRDPPPPSRSAAAVPAAGDPAAPAGTFGGRAPPASEIALGRLLPPLIPRRARPLGGRRSAAQEIALSRVPAASSAAFRGGVSRGGGLCLSSPCSRGGDGSWRCVDRSLRQSVADRDSRTEAPRGCCRCAARPRSAGRRCRAGAPQGSYRDRILRRLERPPRDSAGGARGAVVAVGAAGAAMAHSRRGHSLPRGVGTGCSAVRAPTRCSADDDDTGGGRCRGCRRGSSANGGSGGNRDNTGESGIGCGGGEGCSVGNDANEVAGCRHTTAPTDDSGGRSGSGCGGVSRVRAAACRGAGARWP